MNSSKVVSIAAISLLFATIAYGMEHQEKIRIMMSGSGDNANYKLIIVPNLQPFAVPHKENPYFALSSTSSFDGAEFIKQTITSNEKNNDLQNVQTMPRITKPKKSNNLFTCFGRK